MPSPPEILKSALGRASVRLEAALTYCDPVRKVGYDLPEVHGVMHLASALAHDDDWHIYPETPLKKDEQKQRLDLLALGTHDGKVARAILLEAKRIWTPGHAENVLEDIEKINGSALDVHPKLDHREGVKDWWVDPERRDSPANYDTTEDRHRRGYEPKTDVWKRLGKYLAHPHAVCFSESCAVRIPADGDTAKTVHLLAAIWKLTLAANGTFTLDLLSQRLDNM